MRVKINGEITPESLLNALESASNACKSVKPDFRFYGANIYLNPYDSDGLPFDLVGSGGAPIIIIISEEPGSIVKPALTAKGSARKKEMMDELNRQNAEHEAFMKQKTEEFRAYATEQMAIQKQKDDKFNEVSRLTSSLIAIMPDRLIDEMNAAVSAVWDELRPVETAGEKKGQPKAMPVFAIKNDGLIVSLKTMSNPYKLKNPIYKNQNLDLIWSNDAWREVTKRITNVLSKLETSMLS